MSGSGDLFPGPTYTNQEVVRSELQVRLTISFVGKGYSSELRLSATEPTLDPSSSKRLDVSKLQAALLRLSEEINSIVSKP